MVSIGGLDLGYGSQMQMVRTNVLVLKADTADYTEADLKKVHNLAVQRFPSQLKPDFTAGIVDAAGTTALDTNITDDVAGGVLKSITEVPVAAGTRVGDTAANNRGLAIEGILNVGACVIQDLATSTSDDLFLESSPSTDTIAGEFSSGVTLQGAVMAAIMNDAESGEAKDPVVSTLDISPILGDGLFAAMTGSVTDTEIDDLVDASEAAETAGSTLTTLKAKLDLGASVVSIMSLCKVQ